MTQPTVQRYGFWVDAYCGEPVAYEDMLADLAQVDVIYLGERHTLMRHHGLQYKIVSDLIANGKTVVLGLEQIEAFQQPIVDRYNQGQINYEDLADRIDWSARWNNYLDYRNIVEAVHKTGGNITALNARQEIIRQVAQKGLNNLTEDERNQLPQEIDTSDEQYREHMNHTMMAMAHVRNEPGMLDRMFAAQVCRDETMAENLSRALSRSDQPNKIAVVLCGSGHVSHASGIPSRLRRKAPHLKDRILVLSGSGDVVLSKKMKAMSRNITITHQQLKCFDSPVADYLHVVNLNGHLQIYPLERNTFESDFDE